MPLSDKFAPLALTQALPLDPAVMFNLAERDWWLLMLNTLDKAATSLASLPAAAAATGAANLATSQGTATTSASTALIARPTRRSAVLRNTHASVALFFGPTGVTAATGMILNAGESIPLTFKGVTQVITSSGSATFSVADEYD